MTFVIKSYLIALFAALVLIGGGLAVSNFALADTASTTVDVGNATPQVTAVTITPDPIVLTPNATTAVTITATISDSNGCDDVFASGTITGVLYRSGVTNGSACSNNALNCYPFTVVEQDDTCAGGADTSGNAVGTSSVWFFADATDASSTFSAENWLAAITATDQAGAKASSTGSAELNTLVALSVQQSTINFAASSGALAAGATSTLADIQRSTTTVDNVGNSGIDLSLEGTPMTSGGNSIGFENEKWATSTVGYESLTFTGTSTASAFNLAKTTTSTASSSQNTFWGIKIPNGTPNGTYSGTNTFSAIWSSD